MKKKQFILQRERERVGAAQEEFQINCWKEFWVALFVFFIRQSPSTIVMWTILHKILPASNSNTRKWTSWERNIHTIAFSSLSVETPPSLTSEWGVVANHSNWTLFWKTKLKDQRFKVKMMELTLLMSVTMFAMAMKAGAFLPDYWGPDTLCLHVRWVCWRLSSKDKEQGLRAVVQKLLFVSVLMNVPENVK